MLNSESILKLYANVLHEDIVANAVPISEIRAGIQCMANAYMKEANFSSSVIEFPNYNDIACRCAYLHKYAPLHTHIVTTVMLKILQKKLTLFRELVENANSFKLCSLGGGPGSDVIGVYSALKFAFSSFNASVTIIDCMEEWCFTFISLLQELKFGEYGTDWHNIGKHFQWKYICSNLLNSMTDEVNKSIASATFITMVKFVSASTCTNTEDMVDKIFRVMKPGALVLFIDNAAGGFTQIVERAGKKNGFKPIFGPLRHEEYDVEALKIDRFGYTSCFKTRVTIILLQKALNNRQPRKNLNSTPSIPNQNAPPAKQLSSLDFVVLKNDNSSMGKMVNISPPRPSQITNHSSAVATPKKPVSNLAIETNRIGISSSNKSSSVSSPDRSNLSISNLSAKEDKTKRPLQKPNADVGQTTLNVPTTKPGSALSDASSFRAPLSAASQSSTRNNTSVPFVNKIPDVTHVSPKFPTRSAPSSDWRSLPEPPPSSAVRTYQPVPGTRRERDQPLVEINDDSQETCCSCCTVS